MKLISGGVTAAKGFRAAGVHAGVKAGSSADKNDLAMVLCDTEASAAGVYTMNRVKAAPIYVTMEHLENGSARGIIANSGNANACAPLGHENAVKMCEAAASATGLRPEDFIVCSTGVIGQTLNVSVIENACPTLASLLSRDGSGDAAAAIMTTDTKKKEIAVSFELGGKEVRLGGIAKGSGMIHPNMGTMLCFLTTDCAISPDVLQDALYEVTKVTFNRVSVDGDTSTNDTCCILASGAAENQLIDWKSEDYDVFYGALKFVCTELAKKIAGDGEGATKLVTCTVSGSRSDEAAEKLAMEVILFVYRAFGESGTPWYQLLTISFLLFLSASYTPLPGASGAQEGGFLLYYRGLFTQGTAGLALLVWRFMTYYLFLIIGAAATILTHLRGGAKARAAARSRPE